jgi:glutamate-1-semialdehyde 2,1-aminomutase
MERPDTLSFTQSRTLLARASHYVPGGVHSGRRAFSPPVCVRSGKGAYLYDIDGNRLIDYHAAYGPIILGHADPGVNEAVMASLNDGVLFGIGTTESEVELAQRIVDLVPSVELVLFSNTGNEATLNAIRVARAFTGRQLIVKMQGSFNGSHDSVLRNILSTRSRIGKRDPGSAGMLDAAVDSCLVCRFNDTASLTTVFQQFGERIAAVILEPVLHNAPTVLPRPGYLAHVRATCDQWGALLIYDEVITGFRHSLGGYQQIAGVYPDLTTMGKALANGFPIAAVGGRRDIMERFTTRPEGDVFYGGTYNANGVGVAAALATLAVLQSEPVYTHIFALGDRMRSGLREIVSRVGIPAFVSGFGSIYCLNFLARDADFESYDDVVANDNALQVRYRKELIRRGVVEMPESHGRNHISYAHTQADVDETLEASEAALKAIADELSVES